MGKICPACGKMKKFESFGKNAQRKDGYELRCKICKNLYNRTYREKNGISSPTGPRLTGITKLDWCNTYRLLEIMGYDISEDIHKQFVNKHHLDYKERPARNKLQFSPTDCLDGFDMADSSTNQ